MRSAKRILYFCGPPRGFFTMRSALPPTAKCHSVAMLARSSVPWRLGPACRVGGLCSSTSTGLLACR
jgi:hypothetical protein